MRTVLTATLFFCTLCTTVESAQTSRESEVKFALYSAAWGENMNDSLRIVVHNRTAGAIQLQRISFLRDSKGGRPVPVELSLDVPAGGFAERELAYIDLLRDDECVERSLSDNWKLTEISNYTLNPSVRNLIIQDTDSFRIYQCVQNVETVWVDRATGDERRYEEWVLYHFESRQR